MAILSLPLFHSQSQSTLSFRPFPSKSSCCQIICSDARKSELKLKLKEVSNVALGLLAAWAVTSASPVIAASQRLPPLSTEPDRCEKAFIGNTIGQANGVYDKPIDLRFCDYTNEKSNLKGKSLAAALMSDAKFDGADMSEVVMSKAYAVGASFKGTPAMTSRGCLESDFKTMAAFVLRAAHVKKRNHVKMIFLVDIPFTWLDQQKMRVFGAPESEAW
ncbi:thylakoid lumenal 17.4 kDa protein, chloroplastic isoform X4 [Euphorbia lathyris]|uniref:thylakoid lumenal 17.4 kDa protein, chloroplastic isoform X4 n=1 Tax=Euphorbia lathyris TaxID=212925 RepID=UPI003313D296